jgi:hypothetical protein
MIGPPASGKTTLVGPVFGSSRAEGFAAVVAVVPTHGRELGALLRDEWIASISSSALPTTVESTPAAPAAATHHLPRALRGGTGGDCFTSARERPRDPGCSGQGLRSLFIDRHERVGAAVRKVQVDNLMA